MTTYWRVLVLVLLVTAGFNVVNDYQDVVIRQRFQEKLNGLQKNQDFLIINNYTTLEELRKTSEQTREQLAALRTAYDKHVRGFRPIGSAPGTPGREEVLEPFPDPIGEVK